ncbi:polyubiquitin-like [Esox lucius]|uniref:Ubiquitin-like domain-containing protein n=1 Tax=Esox lucius TaxID=8010 RepID=A0AAY5KQI1_ESOLU|nr:ubiquitin-like protein ISG15 isoform X1 [Esox lucius]XP_034152220.1 ubiquitin-like protein ISG15 isoform X2 [Esox lucius]XP_034152225.1 polyubiquitin-like [Esox lucius]
MELTITLLNGDSVPLTVPLHTTVGSLKSLIHQTLGVATSTQRLSGVNGNNISLNDDSKTLIDYGLNSGSKVMVLITNPIQVFLKNVNGQVHTYDVVPNETVTQFKAKVENKEKVPANQQRLIHQGRQLEDGKKLEDYGIGNRSTIQLSLRLRGG